ncbi:hypothetical protein [Trinickia dinghuensis]|uniref:Uncharacterized protein n=1 Tax=Trinickia dinghuensis TaxID=2291023 RepID=A0A3D8K305_9BURK|nr:hypothetical protein [Trinickia dinghuensis]RDU99255.1 hypothetical protein DWV00_09050 [Trinickia dinghuensis]
MPYYNDAQIGLQSLINGRDQLENIIRQLEATLSTAVDAYRLFGGPDPRGTDDWVRWVNAQVVRGKHQEWERKIHGVLMGYQREMQSAHKNFAKNRPVGFERADVTVGTTESFAKAIQHKHTVSPENSAVNEMIAKAANQLTGESGEKPLPGQRKIIDMMINDSENWWPFDLKDFDGISAEANLNDGVIPLAWVKAKGAKQILTQLQKYKKGAKGLNQKTVNSFGNHVPNPFAPTPFAQRDPSKPKSSILYHDNGDKANVLTIKIVWGQPRTFLSDQLQPVTVGKMVFVAFRQHGQLTVEYLSHS